jgi:hypothetical protein
MDPCARDFEAPADGLTLDVIEVEEVFASEEVVSHVGDLALDVRLPLRMVDRGGIDDEASVLGVVVEGPLEDGIVAVGLRDRALDVVEDDASADTVEELPGRLEAVDDGLESLTVGHVDVHVAAVDQDHDEGPDESSPVGLGIDDVSQTTEVDLAQLTGLARGAAHGDLALAELAVLDGEAVE